MTLNINRAPALGMDSYPGPYGTGADQPASTHSPTPFLMAGAAGSTSQYACPARITWKSCSGMTAARMSPEVRRQAFDPFFTTRREGGQIGLGLHIVHNIVTNRLGGEVHLRSAPGEERVFVSPCHAGHRA